MRTGFVIVPLSVGLLACSSGHGSGPPGSIPGTIQVPIAKGASGLGRRIALDPQGNVFLASLDPMDRFVVLRWDRASAAWSPPTVLDPQNPFTATNLLVDADGNVTVVWQVPGNPAQMRRYMDGGTWTDISPPSNLSSVVLASEGLGDGDHVVAGVHGQLLLLYEDKTSASLQAMAFAPSGGWTSMGPVATGGPFDGFNAAVLGDGTMLAAWLGSDCLPYSSHAPPGAGWTPAASITPNTGCGNGDPQLLSDRTTDAVATWQEGGTVLSGVQSYAAGAWTAPRAVRMLYGLAIGNGAVMVFDDTGAQYGSAGALQEVGLPANACAFSANFLRMDTSGKAIVAWGCPGPLDTLPVYYSRFAAGSGWTPQTRVDGPSGSTSGTSLLWGMAANDSGEAVAVWSTADPNAGLSELALWVSPLP